VNYFEKHGAGAEANFAVGISRMGFPAGFIGRVGADEFGTYLLNVLRAEAVDTSQVVVDQEAPTGIYFVQRSYPVPEKSSVLYYRMGSAGSRLSPDDVQPDYFRGCELFHISGITFALSESAREAGYKGIQEARKAGARVSLDTNIRLRLWKAERAKEVLRPILKMADSVFTDPDDCEILLGERDTETIITTLLAMGASTVVVKLGEEGAVTGTGREQARVQAIKVPVEDIIGAGDAFASCFAASVTRGESLQRALEAANAAGALVVMVRGDIENLPTLADLERFMESRRKGRIVYR
jgi:sugar/nucleoside kinase (ribokinase family)